MKTKWLFVAVSALAGCLMLLACGMGSNTMPSPGQVTAGQTTAAVITVGDGPSDRVVSFEVTINSLVLTPSSGADVTVISSPTRLEFTHLAGTFEPITNVRIPQGTYTKATITFSHPELTILDSTGSMVEQEAPLTATTAAVIFNPNLVVGSNPVSINFDLNLAKSIVFTVAGNPSVAPVITINTNGMPVGDDDHDNNEVEDVRGVVQMVSGTSLTISVHNGAQMLAFATNASTEFEGVGGLAEIRTGMVVEVRPAMTTDGSLLARKVEVELEDAGEAELEGLVVSTRGTPVSSINLLVHEAEASSAVMAQVGTTTTVTFDSSTRFRIDTGHIDLSKLPFAPTFDASSIVAGQAVEAETEQESATSGAARGVRLREQALTGTVSNLATAGSMSTFTLTLPADSAFAAIAGTATIKVTQTSDSRLNGVSAIRNGDSVRVRGLLFATGSGLQFAADTISPPEEH